MSSGPRIHGAAPSAGPSRAAAAQPPLLRLDRDNLVSSSSPKISMKKAERWSPTRLVHAGQRPAGFRRCHDACE
eukprot:3794327-Pyramimonas_sp.AAC.1